MTALAAWAGILGPPLFVAIFLVLGVTKPGFDATAQFVSEGSVGQLGWVQILNFIVLGGLILLFVTGLWTGFSGEVAARVGTVLMGGFGVALVLSGAFVTDSPGAGTAASIHGLLHNVAGLVVFGSLALACFAFAWVPRPQAGWTAYSLATGIAIAVGFVGWGFAGRWIGIAQRAVIIVGWAWIVALGLRLVGS